MYHDIKQFTNILSKGKSCEMYIGYTESTLTER